MVRKDLVQSHKYRESFCCGNCAYVRHDNRTGTDYCDEFNKKLRSTDEAFINLGCVCDKYESNIIGKEY